MPNSKNNRINKILLSQFLILGIFIVSCKSTQLPEKTPNYENLPGTLVSYKEVKSLTISEMKRLFRPGASMSKITNLLHLDDIRIMKVEYNTVDYKGDTILASGAMIVPKTKNTYPILSYQHGTIISYTQAPSEFESGIESLYLGTFISSTGFIVSMPDYIGFGSSEGKFHPYEYAPGAARNCMDMLYATYQVLKRENIEFNDDLFLAGYSQGANATMAMHQLLEKESDLNVKMSILGSGAYDKVSTLRNILLTDGRLEYIGLYLWVVESYKTIYNLDLEWSDVINEPYATMVDTTPDPINYARLDIEKNPVKLFREDFRQKMLNPQDSSFTQYFRMNNTYDWTPKAPIRLYYGVSDSLVTPTNSINTYESLKEKGCDVKIEKFKDKSHFTAFPPYIFRLYKVLKKER